MTWRFVVAQWRRDLHRLGSIGLPWAVGAISVGIATSSTVGLALLGSSPSSAACLSAMPILCAVLGAAYVGSDFRHGSCMAEALLLGGRQSWGLRSSCAVAQAGALIALVTAVLVVAEWALLRQPLPATAWAVPELLGATVLVGGCWALVGASTAFVVRHQVGAVVALFGYWFLVEPLLEVSVPGIQAALPTRVTAEVLAGAGRPASYALLVVTPLLFSALARVSLARGNLDTREA